MAGLSSMCAFPRLGVDDLEARLEPQPQPPPPPPPPWNAQSRPYIHLPTSISTDRDTIPDSPTKARLAFPTMRNSDHNTDHSTVTPPSTPTRTSHSKSSSISSIANSLSSLRRGDSTSSHTSTRRGIPIEEKEEEEGEAVEDVSDWLGSRELKVFRHWIADYEVKTEDKKKPLGSGLWSDVYLGTPCLPKLGEQMPLPLPPILTPPITPVNSRTQSTAKRGLPSIPRAYAIKHPATKASKPVLRSEAIVLSYLSQFPDSKQYVVDFYGQDMRTDALVLRAMDTTLESFVQEDLNPLSEACRAKELNAIFPPLARELVSGLEWLGQKGIVHADIKPGNILVDACSSLPGLKAVFSDFSSSVLLLRSSTGSSSTTNATSAAPLGGGTWDFLDPRLLSSSVPASPSAESDLWSLAVTLLAVVIGASPFNCAGSNVFRRREMVKHGSPLAYAGYGDEGLKNLARLRTLGSAAEKWFQMVLRNDVMARVDVKEWRRALDAVLY